MKFLRSSHLPNRWHFKFFMLPVAILAVEVEACASIYPCRQEDERRIQGICPWKRTSIRPCCQLIMMDADSPYSSSLHRSIDTEGGVLKYGDPKFGMILGWFWDTPHLAQLLSTSHPPFCTVPPATAVACASASTLLWRWTTATAVPCQGLWGLHLEQWV